MQSTEIIAPQSLIEFEGPEFEGIVRRADPFRPGSTIWCSAPACASAKAGYIISHQNRGWHEAVIRHSNH
ncbi:MAG: hypothetical protein E5Y55_06830 [Mesorhizobium sp.]|uniref:hypothetical protein n=1 Tax=Mesorhizobium sp. TaxID=1871066 RepID=UPI00120BFDE3|nr:hypothetical protein [Mesorhizobium sp.]TIM47572.1 MAG: hypothetical protein E5Y55_06830 [Mesorhizobium sp.]